MKALELGSDGCSGVTEAFLDCCLEHDIAYRTGRTVEGEILTRAEADRRFRECMQAKSRLGIFNPMSWWRWIAVRFFGRGAWKGL